MGNLGNILGFAAFVASCAHAVQKPNEASLNSSPHNEWSQVTSPSTHASESLGFYSKGCLKGAKHLPPDGVGYQTMRISRNRHYGHPDLIRFITEFARLNKALGSSLLIGDLAQPRGGPLPYGHSSHQVGLDADIWFWSHPEQNTRSLTREERDTLPFVSMLNSNGVVDSSRFNNEQIAKLKLAALSPQVERIFVNPAIKTYLCSTLPKNELYWLKTLRPWPGHHEHFHVRLNCPSDSLSCVNQAPAPAGDGCHELIPGRNDDKKSHSEPDPRIEALTTQTEDSGLPPECMKILRE